MVPLALPPKEAVTGRARGDRRLNLEGRAKVASVGNSLDKRKRAHRRRPGKVQGRRRREELPGGKLCPPLPSTFTVQQPKRVPTVSSPVPALTELPVHLGMLPTR